MVETDSLININDARSYVLPISNIIGRRLNRISLLNNKLTVIVSKLYITPDDADKNEICKSITEIISEIELLVLKNIDDTQILEYALAEFTLKSTPVQEPYKNPDNLPVDQHTYFA